MRRAARKATATRALAFLRWLRANNFTFLGMREYTYSGKGENAVVERGEGRGLGILSNPDVRVLRQGKDAVLTTPEILASSTARISSSSPRPTSNLSSIAAPIWTISASSASTRRAM